MIDLNFIKKYPEKFSKLMKHRNASTSVENILKLDKDKRKAFVTRGHIFYKLNKLNFACDDWENAFRKGEVKIKSKLDDFCNK